MTEFPSFLKDNRISLCITTLYFSIHPLINAWVASTKKLNNTAMNIGVQTPLWNLGLNSFGNILRSAIAGSRAGSIGSVFSALLPQAAWEARGKTHRSHLRTFMLLRTSWFNSIHIYQEITAPRRSRSYTKSGKNACFFETPSTQHMIGAYKNEILSECSFGTNSEAF